MYGESSAGISTGARINWLTCLFIEQDINIVNSIFTHMLQKILNEIKIIIWKYRNNVIIFVRMNGKKKEKRVLKGYKVKDSLYKKALRRGQKEKMPLSQLLEKVVEKYADGWTIAVYDTIPELASKIE